MLVATDLDGTLLASDESVSARTRHAAQAAVSAGIHLVIATGRPPRWLPRVLEALELQPTCICANGALIIEPSRDEVTFVAGLDGVEILAVAETLRAVIPDVGFAIEKAPRATEIWSHGTTFAHDDNYRPRWVVPIDVPVGPLHELLDDRPVLKMLARSERELSQSEVDAYATAAMDALRGRVEVTQSERSRMLLEISAIGIDKGTALARVAGALGITAANVAAVGDMLNDYAMLQWAGHSFAVANAHPMLFDIASELPSNDDDAVAVLLDLAVATRLNR